MTAELTASFLVASPSLVDPNFERAVVLVIQHQSEGSFGFIVNRTAHISFQEVVSDLDLSAGAPPEVPVLSGGPVAPETGWLLFDPHERAGPDQNSIRVSDELVVSTSLEMLAMVAKKSDAPRHLLVLGYAGWAPGQLESEIQEGTWIPVDLDAHLIFETPLEDRWLAALESLGIDPNQWVSHSTVFN